MAATKVNVRNNGPILIEGDIEICDADGGQYGLAGRRVIALCRCGFSENKPFCDGHHNTNGFQSQCHAYALPEPKPKV
jgi:CDGSH-type Zn-finger protein